MRVPAFVAAIPLSLAMLVPALAQSLPGNPESGLKLARIQCSECHYVEAQWADLQVMFAPDFIDIADSEHTALSLAAYLRTPHSTMPNIILTDEEREDIIAYIISLKNREKD